jgi:hypothetical protein
MINLKLNLYLFHGFTKEKREDAQPWRNTTTPCWSVARVPLWWNMFLPRHVVRGPQQRVRTVARRCPRPGSASTWQQEVNIFHWLVFIKFVNSYCSYSFHRKNNHIDAMLLLFICDWNKSSFYPLKFLKYICALQKAMWFSLMIYN